MPPYSARQGRTVNNGPLSGCRQALTNHLFPFQRRRDRPAASTSISLSHLTTHALPLNRQSSRQMQAAPRPRPGASSQPLISGGSVLSKRPICVWNGHACCFAARCPKALPAQLSLQQACFTHRTTRRSFFGYRGCARASVAYRASAVGHGPGMLFSVPRRC